LIELVLHGNVEAFEPLITPYRKTILSLAYRLSRNREDAQEISQDALLRAFRYLRTYDKKRSFRNWLLQILVNAWRSRQKPKPERESPEQFLQRSSDDDPQQRHLQEEARTQLLDCLACLSPREKEVVLLRDIEDRSIKDTATILGSSPLSVRVHLCSARKKLKDRIKEKFPFLIEDRR